MKRRSLAGVAIVTLIALIAAVSIHRSQQANSDVTSSADLLLPQLAGHLNEVSAIKLSTAGQKEIATFKRGDKGWLLANRSNYPADAAKLRELVLKLSDAKTIEAKTKNPDLYSRLGVEDVTAPTAGGVLVALDGMPKKFAVIIGNVNGGGGGGTFARRMGDEQSWLIAGTLTVDRNASDWIAKEITDIPSSRIREVVIEKDGKTLRVSKPTGSDGNFVIDNIPSGRKPSSEFAANGLAAALAGLRVDDVTAAAQIPAPQDAIKARYLTANGIRVDATAWTIDDKHYAQFKATIDEATTSDWQGMKQVGQDVAHPAAAAIITDAASAQAASTEEASASPIASADPSKDRTDKLAAIQDEVDRLNAAFDGWTFTLPAYKFDNINKGMDDLLQPAAAAKVMPANSVKSNKK